MDELKEQLAASKLSMDVETLKGIIPQIKMPFDSLLGIMPKSPFDSLLGSMNKYPLDEIARALKMNTDFGSILKYQVDLSLVMKNLADMTSGSYLARALGPLMDLNRDPRLELVQEVLRSAKLSEHMATAAAFKQGLLTDEFKAFIESASQFQYRISDSDRDLMTVGDEEISEDDRRAAAERLAAGEYSKPLTSKQWAVFGARIIEAVQERYGTDVHWKVGLRSAVADAIWLSVIDSKRVHPYILLTLDGKREKIVKDPGSLGIVPYDDLGVSLYFDWLRARINREVMEMLVPDWRESRHGPHLQLDEEVDEIITLRGLNELVSEMSAKEDREKAARALLEVLEVVSPKQREILQFLSQNMSVKETAEKMNIKPSTVYVQMNRIKAKLASKAA